MPRALLIPAYDDSRLAEAYGKRASTTRAEVRVLSRLLFLMVPGLTLLDVPCGNGRLAPFLRTFRPRVLVGVDGAAAMARRSGNLYDHSIVGDASAIPLPDRSVDVALCVRLLHHFPDPVERLAILRELARVSRGFVLFSFYRSSTLEGVRRRLRTGLAPTRGGLPLRRIHEEAGSAGLLPIRAASLCPFVREQTFVLAKVRA